MSFCQSQSGISNAERRLIFLASGPESSRSALPERSERPPEIGGSAASEITNRQATEAQFARQQQEAEKYVTDLQRAERQLEENITREDLTRLLDRHERTVANWMTAPDSDVAEFKRGLHPLLKLPRSHGFQTPSIPLNGTQIP